MHSQSFYQIMALLEHYLVLLFLFSGFHFYHFPMTKTWHLSFKSPRAGSRKALSQSVDEESPVKQHEATKDPKTRQTIHDDPLADVLCEEDEEEYVVPDPAHCDRYLVCPLGEVEVCREGETLDTETGYCQQREAVDCGPRHLNIRDNIKQVELRLETRVQEILRSG